jgi:bacteriocin-like protein
LRKKGCRWHLLRQPMGGKKAGVGDIRRLIMRELTTKELDTVIGGGISSPGVYLQEISANLISIPGVTTTAQQTFVYQKNSFHHKVLP